MNKERRKKIGECAEKLAELRDELMELQSQEQEYMDNMPENMQEGQKYEESEGYVDALEDACRCIDDAIDQLEDI